MKRKKVCLGFGVDMNNEVIYKSFMAAIYNKNFRRTAKLFYVWGFVFYYQIGSCSKEISVSNIHSEFYGSVKRLLESSKIPRFYVMKEVKAH